MNYSKHLLNIHPSWYNTINSLPISIQNVLKGMDDKVDNPIPNYVDAFRIFNLDKNKIVGVIINWLPPNRSDANGLLVATYGNKLSAELQAIKDNINYFIINPNINDNLDLEYLSNQNILLLNIHFTLNFAYFDMYKVFSKYILHNLYIDIPTIPVLLLGTQVADFCKKSPLNTIIMPDYDDELFITNNGFIHFVQNIHYYFNIKIKL